MNYNMAEPSTTYQQNPAAIPYSGVMPSILRNSADAPILAPNLAELKVRYAETPADNFYHEAGAQAAQAARHSSKKHRHGMTVLPFSESPKKLNKFLTNLSPGQKAALQNDPIAMSFLQSGDVGGLIAELDRFIWVEARADAGWGGDYSGARGGRYDNDNSSYDSYSSSSYAGDSPVVAFNSGSNFGLVPKVENATPSFLGSKMGTEAGTKAAEKFGAGDYHGSKSKGADNPYAFGLDAAGAVKKLDSGAAVGPSDGRGIKHEASMSVAAGAGKFSSSPGVVSMDYAHVSPAISGGATSMSFMKADARPAEAASPSEAPARSSSGGGATQRPAAARTVSPALNAAPHPPT